MTNPTQTEPDGFVSLAREAIGISRRGQGELEQRALAILARHAGTHVHLHSLAA